MINGFIAIVDQDGDIQQTLGENASDDLVWALCRNLDSESPSDAPHKPYQWKSYGGLDGRWQEYF